MSALSEPAFGRAQASPLKTYIHDLTASGQAQNLSLAPRR
jgi:hypothetical protein